MSLLTHVCKVFTETLLSSRYRELTEDWSETELHKHVRKYIFAPANPADYFFSTIVCVTIHPIPDENNDKFWLEIGEKIRIKGYDVWFEALCEGQMGLVHEIKREKKLNAIVAASSQEYKSGLDARIQATLERYNIHSPIEQVFYASWECVRERLWLRQDSAVSRFLWRFQLRPQYVFYRNPLEKPSHLHTQAYKEWSEWRRHGAVYRVDFVVVELNTAIYFDSTRSLNSLEREGETFELQRVAIECDSFQFHVKNLSSRDFEALKRRERFFAARKWQVFGFTGSEILKTPMACIKEVHQHLLAMSEQLDGNLEHSSIYQEIPASDLTS